MMITEIGFFSHTPHTHTHTPTYLANQPPARQHFQQSTFFAPLQLNTGSHLPTLMAGAIKRHIYSPAFNMPFLTESPHDTLSAGG